MSAKKTSTRFNPIRHKFGAIATVRNGIKFASKKEAAYYNSLIGKQASGAVLFFLRQVPFHLPGGVRYVLDFLEFHADGTVRAVDVKGMQTESFKAKKRMVEDLYHPLTIDII